MYTCGKCQSVYFIDITGQPEFGDMSAQIPSTEPSVEVIDHNNSEHLQYENVNNNSGSGFSNDLASEVSADFADQSLTSQAQSEPPIPEELSSFSLAAGEITDFANQDNSISALSYDLLITGLDSKETTALFKEAVEDSKFGWVSQDIFSKIKNGQYEFKNLNPIQAHILAKRIQFLDIEMQWKQNVQV